MEAKTITISESEYNELLYDSSKLQSLKEAGVDNWSGYDYAMDLFRETDEYKKSRE